MSQPHGIRIGKILDLITLITVVELGSLAEPAVAAWPSSCVRDARPDREAAWRIGWQPIPFRISEVT